MLSVFIEKNMSASFSHWKAMKPQVLTFQTFLFFFFPLAIAFVPRRMKDACVQVAAEKPLRSRGDYPGMVQVISLSKETEIRSNSI